MLKIKFHRSFIIPLVLSGSFLCANDAYADPCGNPEDNPKFVEKIITQTGIVLREQALISCKLDPTNPSNAIMAYAQWIPVKDDPENGSYNLTLLKFNLKNLQVNYRYPVKGELVSDAISLDSIELDTANYKISNQQRALGLRLHYSGHSQPNPYSMTLLNLYDLQNKKQVLDSFIVDQYQVDTDTRCNADIRTRKSILSMQNTQSKGYFDIQVQSKIDHYQMNGTPENCQESKHKRSQHHFLLKYDGHEYQMPKSFKNDYQY